MYVCASVATDRRHNDCEKETLRETEAGCYLSQLPTNLIADRIGTRQETPTLYHIIHNALSDKKNNILSVIFQLFHQM